jgi:hypothetical protein
METAYIPAPSDLTKSTPLRRLDRWNLRKQPPANVHPRCFANGLATIRFLYDSGKRCGQKSPQKVHDMEEEDAETDQDRGNPAS